jgi:hypothetical protein
MTSQTRTRVVVAILFAVLTGVYATSRALHEPNWPTDFDQLWFAARGLLKGTDPYVVVGPGRQFQWDWPLYYPVTAVLLAVPFTVLPVLWARVAFSTVTAALLGWAIGPRVRTHWPILLSAAYIISTSRVQWAPVLLAALWMPLLGFVVTAKPNVGLAALAAQSRRGILIALAGCTIFFLLSLLVLPEWIASWRDAIETAPHIQPAVAALPAGPVLLLATLKWKRPDARLLLCLALIPHTPSVYDLLLLFFVSRTLRESLVLALLTQVLYWSIVLFGSFNTFDAYAEGLGRAAVFIVYLPALIAILFRPNSDAQDEGAPEKGARMVIVPRNWPDAILLSLLLIAATLLVWLPLVTYR